MKKSTLFFKVMVLLALLVPWTSWGQDDVSTQSFGGSWHDNSKTKGTLTLTIDGSGNIVDGEYKSSNYGGIRAEESVSKGVLSFDLQDWKFAESRNSPVISSSYGWNAQSYFSIKLDGENEGGHETVKISKGQNALSDFNKYFKIKVTKNHNEGNIKVVFKKGQTSLSDATVIINSDAQSGTKTYDGKPITVEVKVGNKTLTLGEDYVVVIGNKTITIASELPKDVKIENGKVVNYEITIKAKECGNYSGEKANVTAKITPKELTVTIKDQTKTLPGGKIETDASQWAEIKDKETIISGDKVSLTGKIKEGEDGKLVADGDITTSNTNYTVKTVEPGTLTVKYELTDENWRQILEVTGEGEYTYDGNEHAATVTGKDGLDLSKCIEIVYRKKIEQGGTSIINGKPIDAGEYEIVVRASGECDNVSITGENKQITVGEITINKREITVTGSLTIKEGEPLGNSYKFADIKDLKAEGIVSDEEETVKGAITITPEDKENPTASDDAFIITLAETVINYTISEESKIALVVEEDPDKWQEGEAVETIVVSVNSSNVITKSDKDDYKVLEGGALQISFDKGTLAGYKISKEENQPVVSGEVSQYFAWEAIGNSYDVLMVRGQDGAYNAIPNSVKIRITNEEKDGYIQINFVKDESTEEPGGDDEDMTWAEDGNKKASITVYVNAETGKVIKSEPAMESEGVIDLDKVNSELSGWAYATEDSKPIIVDEESISSVYTFVMDNENLVVGPTESFDAEGLPEAVKVKIEKDTEAGHLLIAFKTVTVIENDDINKGGDDDNNDEQIDDDKITFVGDATSAKYVIYDGLPHGLGMLEITVDGETKVLKETDGAYDVVYGESEEKPVDAGTYSATITFNEAKGYSGTVILENSVKIEKRPLNISFSFSEPIEEGKVPTLDDAEISLGETSLGEGDYLTDCIDVTFRISNEQNADKKYDVYIEHIFITNSTSENNGFKPSNYDITIVCKDGVSVKMEDTNGDGVLNDNDENFNDDSVGDIAVDDIETVDPDTGEGSTGTFYKKYELYLANKDYLKNNEETREHYASEGLELFSRHNKKTTWAGGSFTIWYEHNGEMNEGGYRIFWSNRADGDYKEVKLDEVSGYYQIRNVNSNVYVKLYYETGFPVANEEITATDARAYAQANKIVVITPEPTDVQVISMAGAVVATDQVIGQREFANLAEGVYIVRKGETVIKLQVRN